MMQRPIVFLFPGQGSQYARMGLELYRELPTCRAVFESADDMLGRPLSRLIFEGRAAELDKTDNCQPAISVVNAACVEAVRGRGFQPVAVAGHSLGEYAACYAAGVFDLSQLMRLTQARGSLMAKSAKARPGRMSAVIGLPPTQIEQVVAEASAEGVLCVANFNSDDQIVLSGETKALARAGELALRAGAKRTVPLRVTGAWHSPLMADNKPEFEALLLSESFADARCDLYPNVTAEPTRSGETIRRLLAAQYDSSVHWAPTIRNMIRDYPEAIFVEVGPGRALTGLLLSMDRTRTIYQVDSPRGLDLLVRKVE
jgi:[acyl-carrier-protein] S-malonyltransferase